MSKICSYLQDGKIQKSKRRNVYKKGEDDRKFQHICRCRLRNLYKKKNV